MAKIGVTVLRSMLYTAICSLALMIIALSTAIAADVFSESKRVLLFGGDSAYPPFEWSNNGIPTGFNIELAQHISQSGGMRIEHQLGPWNQIEQALVLGEIDVAPMFISEDRKSVFQFTTPFYVVNHAIYGAEGQSVIGGIEHLPKQRIAVEKQSFAHQQLISEGTDVEIVYVDNSFQALTAIANGTADFALLNTSTAEYLIDIHDLPFKRRSTPFWAREYAFAVRNGEDELQLWLQSALNEVLESGAYGKVYEKWRPEISSGFSSDIRIPFYVGYTAIIAILLMIFFLLWSWFLRQRLRKKTVDLDVALRQARRAESEAQFIADYETETGLARPHHFCQLVDEVLANQPHDYELLIFKLAYISDVQGTLGQQYSQELINFITSLLKSEITGPSGYHGRGIFSVFSGRSEIKKLIKELTAHQSAELPYSKYVAGSALFPEHGTDSATLLANADLALSATLNSPQDWILYDATMAPDPRHQEIITAFRTNSLEGMHAVFQPQTDIISGQITGAEALVRWQHPTLGFLNPDVFIPLVEKLGFVSQVTELMLDEAVRVSTMLRDQNRPITLSVNVSVHDLSCSGFVSLVEQLIKRHGANFCDLKLELTETSFSDESIRIGSVLQRLKELGVKISIDDFGTGYSSLAYLSIFPIQELKIDRSFVSDMVSNSKNCNIIHSTMMLAEHLQLKTVAEGVEDARTLELLRELGCDYAQGYFISKPLPKAEFFKFLDKSQAG